MNNINFFAHTTQLKGSKHSLNVLLENFSCFSYRKWKFTWLLATGLRSIAIIISNCICSLNVITLSLLKVHSTILCEMKLFSANEYKIPFAISIVSLVHIFLIYFCVYFVVIVIRKVLFASDKNPIAKYLRWYIKTMENFIDTEMSIFHCPCFIDTYKCWFFLQPIYG